MDNLLPLTEYVLYTIENLKGLLIKVMTHEEFNKWLQSIPNEEKEPFCPFECGYCDVAYSEACFECQGRDLRFNE